MRQAIRQALWSVYYHAYNLRSLRPSLLERPEPPTSWGKAFAPIRLDHALAILIQKHDDHDAMRGQRALRILGRAGFANGERLHELEEAARADSDHPEWLEQVRGVRKGVEALSSALGIDFPTLLTVPPMLFDTFLDGRIAALLLPCQVTDATCVACYEPFEVMTGRPMTTVTARALVKRNLPDLAKVLDPRSWGTCMDNFDTERRDPLDVSKRYPDSDPPTSPALGTPWAPGYLWERVVLATAASQNVFENILEITKFTVNAAEVHVEYILDDSLKLEIPSFFNYALPGCVTKDEGHSRATPTGTPGWSQLEVVKKVQFVKIPTTPGANPWGLEIEELLNFWAPVTLCMWLEDATLGAPCCTP